MGEGKDLPLNYVFSPPPHMVYGPDIADLIQEIYPGIANAGPVQDAYFLERGILSPRNTEVNEINSLVYRQFVRYSISYSSIYVKHIYISFCYI